MAKQDALFLLEALVDKVVFVKSPCFSDRDFRTCVKIECPAVEPLEICDDDPGSCIARSGGPFVKTFNSGKSCLFSLQESDISSAMSKFPVHVTVYKSLPCGCLPTKIVMGEATIDMTKEFISARKKFLEDPSSVSYEALKDTFRIIGPDKTESGEIAMFLRISCFGKLIVTRFQGASGLPNLGAGGQPAIVDRSCTPRRDFQTTNEPCVCGAARGAAGGSNATPSKGPCGKGCEKGSKGNAVCPPAQDPYDSMPCEDPDDPCYCSGPKPQQKEHMVCRNMDQYCLHVPKGHLANWPLNQDLKEDQIKKVIESSLIENNLNIHVAAPCLHHSETISTVDETFLHYLEDVHLSRGLFQGKNGFSTNSLRSVKSKSSIVLFPGTTEYISRSYNNFSSILYHTIPTHTLKKEEMVVYMTLLNNLFQHRTYGTQATASINKCLQVNTPHSISGRSIPIEKNSSHRSSCYTSALSYENEKTLLIDEWRHSDIYYFSKKRDNPEMEKLGMGLKTRPHRTPKENKDGKGKNAGTKVPSRASVGVESTSEKGNNTKCVSIKDVKTGPKECDMPVPCCSGKSEMMATVSHIQIGPKEPCPFYGNSPCQGPKCIVAATGQDEKAPVKVTTVANPRRGVFELVIRRMTGAPLAKNELMLEWTPPPSSPPPCGGPCSAMCCASPCRPPRCRPAPSKPKCCKKPCRPPPCRPKPCRKVKCKRPPCRPMPCPPTPCGRPCPPVSCALALCPPVPCWPPRCRPKPCRSKPCRPSPCRRPVRPVYILSARPSLTCKRCCKSCPPIPCRMPCGIPCTSPGKSPPCGSPPCTSPPPCFPPPCGSPPCSSSPCLRPCPIGYRKPRKIHSQPKIKAHRQRASPCCNRSRTCPAVRCRSGPCISCSGKPCCPGQPRKCCSVFPFKPKCPKSSCSTCC